MTWQQSVSFPLGCWTVGTDALQVDLSTAFEDGRAFLECLETRRKNGRLSKEEEAKAMDALKERFREEYRKVRKK